MDSHHRHPRYYQGRSLGYYSSQYQQPHVPDRGWSPWQSPSVAVQYRRSSGRPWGTVLLAAAAFLIILAVVIIAGLAIYMGALKLEVSQYLVLDGSFRVVSGDSYNSSLLDHTSNLFQRKSQIYRLMIESILRKSDLSPAIKQSSILGFTNGSLVVFFRLILDRRKIPKKQIILEERIKSIILNGVSTSSPVKNFRIDKSQIFIKRVADELSNSSFEEGETKNQTVEIHNGLLRKSPPQVVTAHYTSSSSNQSSVQKGSTTKNYGLIEGSFKLSSPKPVTREQTTTTPTVSKTPPYGLDLKNIKSNISSKNNSKSDATIDFFQHSPALNAFLNQKLKAEKVTNTTLYAEPTEPVINYGEANLITLLPYTFHNENEPWIPMLPENFTRYPERKPYDYVTEDYSTEGIGVVEVVIDPDDLKSSLPYKPDWSEISSRKNDRSNFTNDYYSSQNKHSEKKNTQEIGFLPKDSQLSYLLNTQVGGQGQTIEKNIGNKIFEEIFSNERHYSDVSSREGDALPEFPIIQEFHKLDALLRSYNVDDKSSELPVTLLPARSNVNMKQQIRPKPSPTAGVGSSFPIEFGESKPRANIQNIEQKGVSFSVVPVNYSKKSEKADEIDDQYFQRSTPNKSDNVFFVAGKKLLEEKATLVYRIPDRESNKNQAESIDDFTVTPITESVTTNFDESPSTEETDGFDSVTTLEPYPASSSTENRYFNMARISKSEELPFKVVLQKSDENQSSPIVPLTNADRNNVNSSNFFVVKLKDTKMQEVLEKIMYNLTSEGSLSSFDLDEEDSSHTISDETSKDDVDNIAYNRKYDNGPGDSKNSLSSNSTLKSDFIWYYLKHTKNESLGNFKYNDSSNIEIKSNLENNEKVTKSPPKYVINKDGFLMLTKLYNKIPSNMLNKEVQEKSTNITKNHTSECLGSMTIKCGSGECVSTLSRCNNLVDCSDGSDEKNCTCAEFLQAQYLTRKICDGVVDCWDFSDENSCDWCKSGQYVCTNSRVCIDQVQVCNGVSDCPNGDDEKNCISIAPHMTQTDNVKYFSSGTLMIRKEGQWGKLCTQNFDSLSAIFKSKWTLEDLGKVVCKTMTFRNFDSIENINDTDENGHTSNSFYELLYSKEAALRQSPRFGLTFENTNCTEKKVVRITCSTLDCGVRPKANPQWGRTKRLTGSRRSRIVGGGNAGPGSWPWLAALYKEGEFQCGATLISDRWLISAGHCFYHSQDDYWVARLGALRRGTNLPSPYEQLRVVSRILLHPNYVDSGFVNDISLLEMEEPVSFTNYVRPICLPQPSTVLRDGKMCTVIGWGQLFEIGRIFPDTLQEVQLPLISTAECRKRTLFLPLYKVTENMFCAGYDRGGRDACLGDSGGPLMCQEQDGRWSLMGVTSNGYGCARANRPGVYTKVANYISWVHSSIAADSVRNQSAARNISCHGHRCPLGECLPPARICNGFMECSDGSDETNCW